MPCCLPAAEAASLRPGAKHFSITLFLFPVFARSNAPEDNWKLKTLKAKTVAKEFVLKRSCEKLIGFILWYFCNNFRMHDNLNMLISELLLNLEENINMKQQEIELDLLILSDINLSIINFFVKFPSPVPTAGSLMSAVLLFTTRRCQIPHVRV